MPRAHPPDSVPHLHAFAQLCLPYLFPPSQKPAVANSLCCRERASAQFPLEEARRPPAVCTAPWRPPARPESLGSPPPAGPPGSAVQAAVLPRPRPTGQGERLQGHELAGQACLSLGHPSPPSALPGAPLVQLATPLQALPGNRGSRAHPASGPLCKLLGPSPAIINHTFIDNNNITAITRNNLLRLHSMLVWALDTPPALTTSPEGRYQR